MFHLPDAQQTSNQHLHHQKQLNNIAQQAKVDAMIELTTSNFQRNFKHILQASQFFDDSKKKCIFE